MPTEVSNININIYDLTVKSYLLPILIIKWIQFPESSLRLENS